MTARPVIVLGDQAVDRHGPAVAFGPRPPAAAARVPAGERRPSGRRRPRSVAGRGLVGGVTLLLLALLAAWASTAPAPADPGPVERERPTRAPDTSCPGCGSTVAWLAERGEVLVERAGGHARYALGRRGDRLLVGDWDCDGQDTPALYRPSTGDVLRFDRWATSDQPPPTAERRPTGIVGGTPRLARRGRCDEVQVDDPEA